jgi:hypothetical protein
MSDAVPSVPDGGRSRKETGVPPTRQQRDDQDLACPHWCRRDHHPDDRPDDLIHQSSPAFAAVIHGDPRFGPEDHAWPDSVVLRLAQRVGSSAVWLQASSEEGRSVHLLVSAESARRLADAIADLLAML